MSRLLRETPRRTSGSPPPNPITPLAAPITHPLIFDVRSVEDQHGSVRHIGSTYGERRLRLKVGWMPLATTDSSASDVAFASIPDDDFREPAR